MEIRKREASSDDRGHRADILALLQPTHTGIDTMKSSIVKVIAGTLLVGTATLAAAQTPTRAQTFASQIAQMQALAGTSTYTFHTPPVLSAQAADPVGKEPFSQKFAELQ